ncbi:MAG: hypothetical protein RMK99_01795 [Anaerolineales bacterium]|nr:hypothetical protein [Anaerolineales bacterium]
MDAPPSAQGSYTYLLNGSEAGVSETWAAFPQPDGSRVIRAVRSAPAFGTFIEVDAVESAGRITEFEVRWRNTNEGAVAQASARYRLSPSQISVERSINDGLLLRSRIAAPPQLVVSPLLRIFQGPAIRRVAELGRGERVPVLVPWILDPKDGARLLTPLLDYRSAWRVGSASIELGGRQVTAQCYSYIGGHYDDSAEFYLGEDDLLLRYVFCESEGKVWDVRLSESVLVV